jgi:hypothetical protein
MAPWVDSPSSSFSNRQSMLSSVSSVSTVQGFGSAVKVLGLMIGKGLQVWSSGLVVQLVQADEDMLGAAIATDELEWAFSGGGGDTLRLWG